MDVPVDLNNAAKSPPLLSWQFLKLHWAIIPLAFSVLAKNFIAYLLGFHPFFMSFFLLEVLFGLLGFILSSICLVTTIGWVLRRRPFLQFFVVWIIFSTLNFIPGIFPSAAGALTSLILAGPQQVVEEGRYLMATYQPPKDVNCKLAFPPCGQMKDYPPAIQRLNPVYVRVDKDYLLIKKFGLGDIAGFVIYPTGTTPQGIKLMDGLYWIDAW